MSDLIPDEIESVVVPPPPTPPQSEPIAPQLVRSMAVDTWTWLWKDSLGRVLPFVVAAGAYARFSGAGADGIGLSSAHWRKDILWGTALGVPLAGIAAAFRARVAPGYRLPTGPDQALQTTFYFAINAPAEELFWRATVQTLAIRAVRRIPGMKRGAPLAGWALATAVFGAYHRLGNWSWKSIAGVTAAGALFGASYLAQSRRRSILLPTILHGFATAGFLSWGDVALHLRTQRRTHSRHALC